MYGFSHALPQQRPTFKTSSSLGRQQMCKMCPTRSSDLDPIFSSALATENGRLTQPRTDVPHAGVGDQGDGGDAEAGAGGERGLRRVPPPAEVLPDHEGATVAHEGHAEGCNAPEAADLCYDAWKFFSFLSPLFLCLKFMVDWWPVWLQKRFC